MKNIGEKKKNRIKIENENSHYKTMHFECEFWWAKTVERFV
jgi:hypothetical protein